VDETVLVEDGIVGSLDRVGMLTKAVRYLQKENDCARKPCTLNQAIKNHLETAKDHCENLQHSRP
jgi:ferritin-like metal-binding protein YciE